jgi:two-component system, OmpR family, sensor histidine kinase TctE
VGEASIVIPGLGAAGWALGLGLTILVAGERLREARRREALNRALHELRRPLQSLVLCSAAEGEPGSHAIRVALAALGDLDAEINGGRRPFEPRPVVCRALVQPAVERWRGIAAASDRSLVLRWRAGSAVVMADPERLAQALDNLIHNAIRHGGLRVQVEARAFAAGVRISIADSGAPRPGGSAGRDPRHGHGLRVVAAVAAQHGGRFLVRASPAGTTATLELPFASVGPPADDSAREAEAVEPRVGGRSRERPGITGLAR